MRQSYRIGLGLVATLFCVPGAIAAGEVFEMNRDYLCATEQAYFAAPSLASHGDWDAPPTRFQLRIQACETFCLPQVSKERPLSLHVQDEGSDWPQKFEGYRGQASFHSTNGGSVTVSSSGLSMTRMLIGSMPGAENQVSLVLSAKCHPID